MSIAAPDPEADAPAPAAPVEELLHGAPVSRSRGQLVVHPARDQYLAVVTALKADGYAFCSDLCGVDYLTHSGRSLPVGVQPERFEVAVNLLSMAQRARIRVRVQVPEDDPTVASVVQLFPGAEAMEREAWDMLGIAFDGHPDLTRILMPEDWEGHPLRKDYDTGRVPVQFKFPARER